MKSQGQHPWPSRIGVYLLCSQASCIEARNPSFSNNNIYISAQSISEVANQLVVVGDELWTTYCRQKHENTWFTWRVFAGISFQALLILLNPPS